MQHRGRPGGIVAKLPSALPLRHLLYACLLHVLLTGCASQISAPTISHSEGVDNEPWRIHCETAQSMQAPGEVPGVEDGRWIRGRDQAGEPVELHGKLVDGFFELANVTAPANGSVALQRTALRKLCIDTIAARKESEPLMLGWVMAAREHEDVEVPIAYPGRVDGDGISRVVIFGDSLTDSGKLKRRLLVFPDKPYWLGRFSNGPVWPEYLAMATDLSVQNNSYGGASVIYLDPLPGAGIVSHIREKGQMFVSGTIDLQINDYLDKSLNGQDIARPLETLFLIWGGANDYISKEPISGLITTFLNSPEGESGYRAVAQQTVAGLTEHVRMLYRAGGKRFLLLNLPDLGQSPIVLQNTTYTPELANTHDEDARRLELAHRLTELTLYHNERLKQAVNMLQQELPDAEIALLDVFADFSRLTGAVENSTGFSYGYDYSSNEEVLTSAGKGLRLLRPCYSGSYLGTRDPGEICDSPETAVFWDVVHPTTLTHCWQAFSVEKAMHEAGWLGPLPDEPDYLTWCRAIVEKVTFGFQNWSIIDSGSEAESRRAATAK